MKPLTGQKLNGDVTRELANALERAAILAENGLIDASLFPSVGARPAATSAPAATTLDQLERQAIQEALRRSNGHRKQAAEQLGIGLRTLYDKLKQYGIS